MDRGTAKERVWAWPQGRATAVGGVARLPGLGQFAHRLAHALRSAIAAEAAGLQGKYFEMGKMLFAHHDNLEWSDIYRYANAIGLDLERFDQDVRVHPTKVLQRVQDDAQDAELMDLNATPTFFVNGKRHKGPWDSASLIRALEAGRT